MTSAWNIPDDIFDVGSAFGLTPRSTGGNIDYMEKRISSSCGGVDTHVYTLWLASQSDAGSPESLKDKADILVIPVDKEGEENEERALRIRCATSARAIKLMERIEHIYGKDTR